ncbi:hypothetical protein C0584_01290 [Candidatus Parcubacteria bacterium]|nr:MAG: hypothetical protein C0584_01290 [Candidatus Parcubacteria bacterium]
MFSPEKIPTLEESVANEITKARDELDKNENLKAAQHFKNAGDLEKDSRQKKNHYEKALAAVDQIDGPEARGMEKAILGQIDKVL